ncbi:MAG: hypothetical protein ACREBR_00895 [bacterium]
MSNDNNQDDLCTDSSPELGVVCDLCKGENDCDWELFEEQLVNYAYYIAHEDADRTTPMPNNEIRKNVYRQYTLLKHGKLGKENRKPIPECVMDGIRDKWPSDGKYMGFKKKAEICAGNAEGSDECLAESTKDKSNHGDTNKENTKTGNCED